MKLFRNPWFITFGFFLLVKPGIVTGIAALSFLDSAINILRLVLIGYTILCLLFEKHSFNALFQVTIFLALFEVWKVIATYFAPMGTLNLGLIMNTFGVLLFTYCGLKADPTAFIKGGAILFGSYILINCMSVILFPDGIYTTTMYSENYFLSYRTAWFPIYLTGITMVLLNYEYAPKFRNRIWLALVAGAMILSMVLVWTATGLLCFAIGVAVLAMSYTRSARRPIRIEWIIIVEVVLMFLIVILNAQEWFSFIIVEIFNKDVTLTQRTRIWANAIETIMQRPITGQGFLTTEDIEGFLNYGASHAHNYYLNTTLHFGIIGTLIGMFIIWWSHRVPSRSKRSAHIRAITIAAMATLMTSFQVESWLTIGYYLIPLYLLGAYVGMETKRIDGLLEKGV